jgi:hypothetical protein
MKAKFKLNCWLPWCRYCTSNGELTVQIIHQLIKKNEGKFREQQTDSAMCVLAT